MCLQASTATWEAASYGETNLGFYPLHRKRPLNGALCWPPSHCSRLKNNTRCCCTACLPHPSSRARQATSKCSDRRVKLFEIKYASKGAKHQWQLSFIPQGATECHSGCSLVPKQPQLGQGLQVHQSRDTSSAWHCQLRASEQLEVENKEQTTLSR